MVKVGDVDGTDGGDVDGMDGKDGDSIDGKDGDSIDGDSIDGIDGDGIDGGDVDGIDVRGTNLSVSSLGDFEVPACEARGCWASAYEADLVSPDDSPGTDYVDCPSIIGVSWML